MSKQLSAMIPSNTPFEFSGLDCRPSFRASNDGSHVYSVNFMVTEEIWNAIKTIPRHHIIGGVLYWTAGEAGDLQNEDAEIEISIKPPRKQDAPKGEHGAYWNELCKHGIFNHPDLQAALESELSVELNDYEQGLRDVFQVTSRTFVSPIDFEQFLGRYNLAGLITMSRQASAKVG